MNSLARLRAPAALHDHVPAVDNGSRSVLLTTVSGQINFDLGIRAEAAWLRAAEFFWREERREEELRKTCVATWSNSIWAIYLGSQLSGPSVWAVK